MSEQDTNIQEQEELQYGRSVYVWLIAIFLFSLFALISSLQWKNHLLVRQVIVEGEKILTKEEIVQLAKLSPSQMMREMNLYDVQRNIQSHTFVKQVIANRDAPSTLRLTIQERKPIAIVLLHGRTEIYYVDDEGYILPHLMSQSIYDIPVISGLDSVQTLKVGARTNNFDVLAAVEVLKTAERINTELFHLISEIRVRNGHDMVMYSFDSGLPIIFGQGDAVKKLIKFDSFWKQFVNDVHAENVEYIDLRFEDQVVVAEKKI